MAESTSPPSDLVSFLGTDPFRLSGVLALSAAVSLTDELAAYLLELVGVTEPERLTQALQICDFVLEYDREWRISSRVRDHLVAQLAEQPELQRQVHAPLLELARSGRLTRELSSVPRYLTGGAGQPYHAAVFDRADGLRHYSRLGLSGGRNARWLGARLASEQQRSGILPAKAIEVMFLRGMVYYQDGRYSEAEPLLREVAADGSNRAEVAISLHIVGRIDRDRKLFAKAEQELRRSWRILESLGDRAGVAKVLLTLGQMFMQRDVGRGEQAETLLRQSLEIEQSLHSLAGEAMVLHTLGQLLGRDHRRLSESKQMLRLSLEIEERRGNSAGIAQVLHTLGHRLARERNREASLEAELVLNRSLNLRRQQKDKASEAQVLHTLGELIGHDRHRAGEAENLLLRSLELRREQKDLSSEAQVLHTLGRLIARDKKRKREAIEMLNRSLEIGVQQNMRVHQQQVQATLDRLHAQR